MSNNNQIPIDAQTLRNLAAMVPTVGDATAEQLKAAFSQQQGHTPPIQLETEQAKAEVNGVSFIQFEDGEVLKYDPLPDKPGLFALLVRESSDGIHSKIAHVGTARGAPVAQMLCDGVNFLFACKQAEQRILLDAKAEEMKGQIIEIPRAKE